MKIITIVVLVGGVRLRGDGHAPHGEDDAGRRLCH